MSARSAHQIMSIKGEYPFRFSIFLVICVCNSSANFLLEIILFLTVSTEVDLSTSKAGFLSKNLWTS